MVTLLTELGPGRCAAILAICLTAPAAAASTDQAGAAANAQASSAPQAANAQSSGSSPQAAAAFGYGREFDGEYYAPSTGGPARLMNCRPMPRLALPRCTYRPPADPQSSPSGNVKPDPGQR